MEDLQTNSQIDGEHCEEFYEKIEAPKFVDFTSLDSYRPQHDDRYWFCLRVGCDQRHEEEMNPEEIYKNFVLRVMAARSPNVRFRKVLNGKASSANVKCPHTAPAKSSKSRMPKLALISSISQRMVEEKVKVKPPVSKLNGTLNARTQNSTLVKALATPRNRMPLSNPILCKSARDLNSAIVAKPKSKVATKALVFNSPKKEIKTKASFELDTSVRKICSGIKELDITSEKNQVLGYKKPLPSNYSRRKLGREVKSRVYDSLHAQKCKRNETKSSRCLEREEKAKDLQECQISLSREGVEDDSSDMDIDDKTRVDSIEACSASSPCKINGHGNKEFLETIKSLELPRSDDISVEVLGANMTSLSATEGNNHRESDHGQKLGTNSVKGKIIEQMDNDDKENVSDANGQGKESEIVESDDKENVTAKHNRKFNIHIRHPENKIIGKQEGYKNPEKVSRVMNKTSTTNSTATSFHGVKYRKPKATNPKPFRLRTDERQILKEENLGKKLHHVSPLKEVITFPRGISGKKNQRILQDQPRRMGTSCSRTSELHTTTINNRGIVVSQLEKSQYKASQGSKFLKMTKSPSKGVVSSRKRIDSLVTHSQLSTIKETSPTILHAKEVTKLGECSTISTNKTSSEPSSRSSSRRRHLTIPKEPYFHRMHVPKSCTRK